jgi:polysaccharide chain length determinant protein (PEP-CTERM system associated)
MEKDLELKDIKGFIRRRKKIFITCMLIVFLCGLSLAIALPPIYKSEATIQLKGQQIPTDYVKPTITDFAEERIQKISQQVLSRPKLLEIIDTFDLYHDLKDRKTPTELVGKMRETIGVETVAVEVSNKNKKSRKKESTATVAFNIFFEGKDPATVQKVTHKLANLYLEEDVKNRESRVMGTTNFLENEIERLKNEINRMEKTISNYKKKHLRELPSDRGYNLQAIARLERVMDQTDLRLRVLQEKKLILNSQLLSVKPMAPVMVDGKDIATTPDQRLRDLRFELAHQRTIYSERHPDIKILKREIAKLEKEIGSSGDSNANMKLVAEKADNPAYINLKTQIETIQMEIEALQEEKDQLAHELDVYQQRIEGTPNVEKELNALSRDYENFKRRYAEMSNKLMNAQVFQEMEGKQKGARFSITSTAYLPQKPSKPNRFAIILFTFLIAIGLSSVLVVALESVDNTIKTTDQLKILAGVPVLSAITYIVTEEEKRSIQLKRLGWGFITICFIGAAMYCVDKYFMKLEYLWTFILNRLKMIV